MIFTKNYLLNRVYVDRWSVWAEWSLKLLALADPEWLRVEGDLIIVTVTNGWAHYRITGRDERIVSSVFEDGFVRPMSAIEPNA